MNEKKEKKKRKGMKKMKKHKRRSVSVCLSAFLSGWCHAKPTMDGVKFVNLTCWKIEENHTSSCSLAIITYGSILGFS